MGVGCRSPPQRLLWTQQSNPHLACLLDWQADSTPSEPPRKPLVQSVCESHSVVPHSLRLYSPWDSPGQNTGVGSCSLLQGIFPTQGSNPGLPHCRWVQCTMKIKRKMDLGGQQGELSCTHSVHTDPNRKRLTLNLLQEWYYFTTTKRRRVSPNLTTVQPMRDCLNSAKENPLYSELPLSSSQLSFYNKPPQLPLLLYKESSLLCLARLACYLL